MPVRAQRQKDAGDLMPKKRVIAEIKCPGFSGGTFTVNRKKDYCALEEAAKESVLGLGCSITLKAVDKTKAPAQGSMFSRKKTTPQQSLFGAIRKGMMFGFWGRGRR
jgi:hypothetical protein